MKICFPVSADLILRSYGNAGMYPDFPLVTRNTDDFKGIEGLGLINPFAPPVTPAPEDKTS